MHCPVWSVLTKGSFALPDRLHPSPWHRPTLCRADMLSARADACSGLAAPLASPPLYQQLPADVLTAQALCSTLVSLRKHSGEITEPYTNLAVKRKLLVGQRSAWVRDQHDIKTSSKCKDGVNVWPTSKVSSPAPWLSQHGSTWSGSGWPVTKGGGERHVSYYWRKGLVSAVVHQVWGGSSNHDH